MGVVSKLLQLERVDTVVVVGGDAITLAVGQTAPWTMPAYITLENTHKRVVAVGEDARMMWKREPANLSVYKFARQGGFSGTHDIAEAGLRYAFRLRIPRHIVSPRVLAVCPHEHSRTVKEACVHAGCREVITIRPAMAAALGLALKVEEPDIKAVFVLERDWCAFALISVSGFIAEFELSLGIDALLEDIALHAMATRNVVLDINALYDVMLKDGLGGGRMLGWEIWADELESGRVTSSDYSERDFMRGSLPFLFRLNWHYRQALQKVDKAKSRDGSAGRLHLCSPYARLPGVAQLIGKAFQREVNMPSSGEIAMAKGGQAFFRNLDEIYRIAG